MLERAGVEVVQRTSGRFKRSLQQFEPNTPEGLQKYQEEIDAIHAAFQNDQTSTNQGAQGPNGPRGQQERQSLTCRGQIRTCWGQGLTCRGHSLTCCTG